MKKYKFLILLIFLNSIASYCYSQTIAYANMDKIIQDSNVGQKIILYFNKEKEIITKNIKNQENIIKENEKLLISQKNVLQDEEYKIKVEKIRNDIKQYNIMRDNQLKNFNLRKDKISKSFLIEINKILREYAENNEIDMILSSNQMLIGKSNFDVTEKILNEVNKKIKKFDIE